jgi:D-alanyl-D-alanine carboxypeptidase (penicillin-binding protein 5/6)
MRTRRRLRAALPGVVLLLLLAPASAAAQPGADPAVVGGPQLADPGVVVPPTAPPLPDGITAASWLVADLDTGEVLAAKDAHGRYAPASTIKTLTALALLPELGTERTVVPTYDDVAVEGSRVGLVEDVAYPTEELFAAMLMVSGNDAASALGTAVGGQEKAAALMNELARDLQALDTRAVNPHGLDAEGQLSSAYDLALIARAGMAEPDFARWVATSKSSVGAPEGQPRIETYNKNKLLRSYEGALGIKNGYTIAARASFVGAAERDGRRLVVTLMRAEPRVWEEAGRLLDWGFRTGTTAAPVGQLVAPVSAQAEPVTPPAASAAPAAPVTPAAAPTAEAEDGGLPLVGTTVTVVVLGGLVAVRRRQVVIAQRRRRRLREQEARRRAAARRAQASAGRPVRFPEVSPPSGEGVRASPVVGDALPRASGMP